MKKLIAVAALLASSAIAPATLAQDVSVSTSIDYVTEYVFRGVSLEDSAIQPGIEVSVGDFSVGAWASTGLGSDSMADTDEIDFYAGYGFSLSDTVSASVGATLYHYPDGGDTLEFSAGVGFDTVLSPSVTAYYDIDLEAFTLEGGLGHSFPVSEATSFDLGVTGGLVMVDGGGDYEYGQATASLGYAFTEDVSVYAAANYVLSSEDTLGFTKTTPKDNLFYLGVGVAAGF
ncbi:uncharacterized protein (TIGR02001 family) [Litorimonas taeanensis]|uniref:Uncharacterized protein (TIGR02001 family) n=1 Tax=Litorimonas taeanensis TaxID=568099 RepID=A0A420WF28_9PROT|nr:TorF family putative porin [Litorimonas taeanensis]RKQ69569.1 uncharacterized protein (TIGR02001 family) [Litorimonas taeanensis]